MLIQLSDPTPNNGSLLEVTGIALNKTDFGDYRYGFNGKENDQEWGKLIQDYGFRLYNPAIAKFLSVDPLAPSYPWYTPYQFAGNKPINSIDIDGLEEGAAYRQDAYIKYKAKVTKDDLQKVRAKNYAMRIFPSSLDLSHVGLSTHAEFHSDIGAGAPNVVLDYAPGEYSFLREKMGYTIAESVNEIGSLTTVGGHGHRHEGVLSDSKGNIVNYVAEGGYSRSPNPSVKTESSNDFIVGADFTPVGIQVGVGLGTHYKDFFEATDISADILPFGLALGSDGSIKVDAGLGIGLSASKTTTSVKWSLAYHRKDLKRLRSAVEKVYLSHLKHEGSSFSVDKHWFKKDSFIFVINAKWYGGGDNVYVTIPFVKDKEHGMSKDHSYRSVNVVVKK